MLHGCGEHERVLESSREVGLYGGKKPGEHDVCLFLQGDSLRQLRRYDEALVALSQIVNPGEVFWLDRDFIGSLPLGPQSRLSRALAKVRDPSAFPQTEAEYIELTFRYYGMEGHFADEVAQACAIGCITKRSAMSRAPGVRPPEHGRRREGGEVTETRHEDAEASRGEHDAKSKDADIPGMIEEQRN